MIFTLLLCLLIGYLLGSIPSGLLLSRWAGLGDVRAVGSGNIGATNVLRLGNKKIAALTLLADMGKGLLAIIVSTQMIYLLMPFAGANQAPECDDHQVANLLYDACGYTGGQMEYVLFLAGMAAVIGHMFPVWLKYKGGKGVATFFGVILGFMWQVGLLALATWIVAAILSHRSSIGALVATALTPLYMLVINLDETLAIINGHATDYGLATLWVAGACIALVALVWYQHRENIARLRAGTEPKIGHIAS
jgi:glycerol-3-phosphate acyltransferase PlsY